MNLFLSLSALGLVTGGATVAALQSSCTSPAPASVACTVTVQSGDARRDKVADRAAELEALAGGAPQAVEAPIAPHSGHAPAVTLAPHSRPGRASALAPVAPVTPVAPIAPVAPCPPTEPAAPSRAQGTERVLIAPRALAQHEREARELHAQAERAQRDAARAQRDAAQELQRAHEAQRRAIERAHAQAQAEVARAQEEAQSHREARRRVERRLLERGQNEQVRGEQGQTRSFGGTARGQGQFRSVAPLKTQDDGAARSTTSPRELELERRVRELEARLEEMARERAPAPQPDSRSGSSRVRVFGVPEAGARVYEVAPKSDGQFEVQAFGSEGADCSPSRVRIYRKGPSGNTTVHRTLEFPFHADVAVNTEWAEDLAAWAEEFAEEQAAAWEELAESQAEAWEAEAEAFAETWEAEAEAWAAEFETWAEEAAATCEPGCEPACEEAPCESNEQDVGIVQKLLQPLRRAGVALASNVVHTEDSDAGSLPQWLSAARFSAPADQIRNAVHEMRGELDGVREALRDLKRQVQELRRAEPR